jgi:hypothetical protein
MNDTHEGCIKIADKMWPNHGSRCNMEIFPPALQAISPPRTMVEEEPCGAPDPWRFWAYFILCGTFLSYLFLPPASEDVTSGMRITVDAP